MRLSLSHPPESRRLFVAGSVCWIICGFDFREPLHADGVDLGDPVLEGSALNFIFDLAIPQGAFCRSTEAKRTEGTISTDCSFACHPLRQQAIDIHLVFCSHIDMPVHNGWDIEPKRESGAVSRRILLAVVEQPGRIESVVGE